MEEYEPIIIHIKGVYKRDINRIIVEQSSEKECLYDPVPAQFTGMQSWIRKTNIHCAGCRMSHDNTPIPMIEYFNPGLGSTSINISRILFCSFPCKSEYINRNYTGNELESRMIGMRYMYQLMTGESISHIPFAPRYEEMTLFGGSGATYTPESFRQVIQRILPTRFLT